jgi:hypothetical protein
MRARPLEPWAKFLLLLLLVVLLMVLALMAFALAHAPPLCPRHQPPICGWARLRSGS